MTRRKDVDPEKSKRARGAKQKGSRAQRDVAKLLGLWFFGDINGFHSSPISGGLRWASDVAKTRGDIICSADQNFPYSIEIKNQEKGQWDLLSLLFNEGPILNKWWDQCLSDAIVVNKLPWLIFTRNQIPFISMIKHFDGKYLGGSPNDPYFKFDDLYISPLAVLLDSNFTDAATLQVRAIDSSTPEGKIISRHYINVMHRINKDAVSK
jgi:hypothetical protein